MSWRSWFITGMSSESLRPRRRAGWAGSGIGEPA